MSTEMQTKVQASPAQNFMPVQTGLSQRKCALCNTPGLVENSTQNKEKLTLQRSSADQDGTTTVPRFGHDFRRVQIHNASPTTIQTKLTIGQPNDRYEQEADRIADQVMAAPTHLGVTGAPPRIQRFSGQSNGHMDGAPASVDRVLASPGRPLDPALQQDMEQRFGHDFSRVRVHSDGTAEQSARDVNAKAYTAGHNIVFGAGRFAPEIHEGRRLLAHELTHVVQQSGTDGNGVGKSNRISSMSPDGVIYRAVESHGGSWDTTAYTATNTGAGVGKVIGAHIDLEFTPNSLVVADTIGLTQTVNTQQSTVAGGPVNDPSSVSTRNAALSLTSGDVGRAIDQGDPTGDTIPNTNPLYAVENAAGSVSATLTDVGATAGFGSHGHRTKRPNDTFDVDPATLNDTPRRTLAFVGQEWRQTFETTALVLDGPMRNTYLGSVEWGWCVGAAGVATLDPDPIELVRAGVPSAEFMAAAAVWNAATFTDPTTGTVHDTVDLPTTSGAVLGSGHDIASNRSTKYLLARIAVVDNEIANIATGAEVVNKQFEKRALETELLRRSAKVSVMVNETEDWLGADEVYVEASSNAGSFKTPVRDLNDGGRHLFLIPLRRLWSVGHVAEPIRIKVFDEDLVRDDLIVHMLWPTPFDDFHNTRSFDGADYDVLLRF